MVDSATYNFGSAVLRQPGTLVYQIFDGDFAEQATHMQSGLGSYTKLAPEVVESVDE